MQNISLGAWPRRRAILTPDCVALVFDGAEITYADFNERVKVLSAALSVRGVGAGDRVAYWGGNHLALLEVLFAALRIGAVAVLVNARLAPKEAAYILDDSGARLLFHGQDQRQAVEEILPEVPADLAVDVDDPAAPGGWNSLHEGEDPVPEVPRGLDDAAILMYTSGTTGRPKGAVLTHGNLFFHDINVLIETDVRPDEICLEQ